VGINLGDIIVEESDILGDGVNIAARLESQAEPGGILLSGTAFDQVRNKLALAFEDRGEQRMKNIAEPVRTYRVRIEGQAAHRRVRSSWIALSIALACLAPAPHHSRPWRFVNVATEDAREALADAMSDSWRADLEASSPTILDSKIGPEETRLYTNPAGEHRDFLDCVRTRKDPYFPVDIGHRVSTVCHLANLALRLGRKLKWDPQQEVFVKDDEANAMRSRPMRSPWTLV